MSVVDTTSKSTHQYITHNVVLMHTFLWVPLGCLWLQKIFAILSPAIIPVKIRYVKYILLLVTGMQWAGGENVSQY